MMDVVSEKKINLENSRASTGNSNRAPVMEEEIILKAN